VDWWIYHALPVLVAFGYPIAVSGLMVIIERRVCAFIQDRVGPNRVDVPLLRYLVGREGLIKIGGLGQPLADAIKLIAKEDIIPARADRRLFTIAPLFVLVPPLVAIVVIPMSMPVGKFSLQAADPGVGLLFVLAVISLSSYGIAFGGWASNSRYSLLGAIRASAQMISYEVGMGLVLVSMFLLSGTARMSEIVGAQAEGFWEWNIFTVPGVIGCGLFVICAFAENNRLPFDLPECEAELVGGYHTEYSAMKFAMFLQGEYIAMLLMSSLMVTLFFGGWHFPGMESETFASWHPVVITLLSLAVFVVKTMLIMLFYVQVRWTLPRFRYDQLMRLGWKTIIPLALANLLLAAAIVTWKAQQEKGAERPDGRSTIHAADRR
jgi:NADH-quinone oxidoreductase subunit H